MRGMVSDSRVTQHCSGFAAQRCRVTLHCRLPVARDQQVCTVLSLSCYVNVLYAFNASHTPRMACLVRI
jgi:hypothetical protein